MDGSNIVAACAVGVRARSIGVTALIYRSSTNAAKKAVGDAQVREDKIRQEEWEHVSSLSKAGTTRDLLLAMDQDLDDIDAATMAVLPTGEPSIYLAVRPHLARLLHSNMKLETEHAGLKQRLERVCELVRISAYAAEINPQVGQPSVVLSATDQGRMAIAAVLRGDPIPDENPLFTRYLVQARINDYPGNGTGDPEFELSANSEVRWEHAAEFLKAARRAGFPRLPPKSAVLGLADKLALHMVRGAA